MYTYQVWTLDLFSIIKVIKEKVSAVAAILEARLEWNMFVKNNTGLPLMMVNICVKVESIDGQMENVITIVHPYLSMCP